MKNRTIDITSLSRRGFLSTGVAWAFAGFPAVRQNRLSELYVFPSMQAGTTVIALTWPIQDSCGKSEVTIHAGPRRWPVRVLEGKAKAAEWDDAGCRFFAGSILSNAARGAKPLNAVVIEAPNGIFAGAGKVDVWAERLECGSRQRAGSPFLAKLMAGSYALETRYHASSPVDDSIVLTDLVSSAIADNARAAGLAPDPELHGRRLARILLPDVLHYDPNLPAGFTLAAQNGRHPQDASDIVVNALLRYASCPAIREPVRLTRTFPYFPRG
jgi:hypothetical protein